MSKIATTITTAFSFIYILKMPWGVGRNWHFRDTNFWGGTMSPDLPSLALLIFFPCIHVPLQNLTLCPCVPRTKQCFNIPVMWRCGLVEDYVPDHHTPLQIIWKVGFFTFFPSPLCNWTCYHAPPIPWNPWRFAIIFLPCPRLFKRWIALSTG